MPLTLDELAQLLRLFKWERVTYLCITVIAVAMLLTSAVFLILRNHPSLSTLTSLFGATGLITVSIGRLLRMWDQALALISSAASGGGNP
jgi:hypothetical protein